MKGEIQPVVGGVYREIISKRHFIVIGIGVWQGNDSFVIKEDHGFVRPSISIHPIGVFNKKVSSEGLIAFRYLYEIDYFGFYNTFLSHPERSYLAKVSINQIDQIFVECLEKKSS